MVTKTITGFIEEHNIELSSVTWKETNPNNPEWKDADHWECVLDSDYGTMTIYFSKGYGHHGEEPHLEEILDCMASDGSSIENVASFEEWANELGYDTDSRKAERIYNLCVKQSEELKTIMGHDAYFELLYDVERQ